MQPRSETCRWCGADAPRGARTCPACGGIAGTPPPRIPRRAMQIAHVESWSALEAFAGPEQQRLFMYMCTLEGGGTRIHLFKHRDTRRYLNIGEDGTAYRYVDDSYEEIPAAQALAHAFS